MKEQEVQTLEPFSDYLVYICHSIPIPEDFLVLVFYIGETFHTAWYRLKLSEKQFLPRIIHLCEKHEIFTIHPRKIMIAKMFGL